MRKRVRVWLMDASRGNLCNMSELLPVVVSESGSGWAESDLCFLEGGGSGRLYPLLKQKLTEAALGEIWLVKVIQ
jgi:hypothetical protein